MDIEEYKRKMATLVTKETQSIDPKKFNRKENKLITKMVNNADFNYRTNGKFTQHSNIPIRNRLRKKLEERKKEQQ